MLACGLLLAGCGLPLPSGVHTPQQVPLEQPRTAPIVVLPPGPADGATPLQVVQGFLGAQVSTAGDHAVAGQYLLPGTAWDREHGVQVYDPDSLEFEVSEDGRTVTVSFVRTARVSPEGAYSATAGTQTATDVYQVAQDTAGRNRLAQVPSGLRLTGADLVASFRPHELHFLAPAYGEATSTSHLVADRVWLEQDEDALARLVRALLRGPTARLRASVTTAVPDGTALRFVGASPDGTVTVDLDGPLDRLSAQRREQLSAQLVWTLRGSGPGFARLRLLVRGQPLPVDGAAEPQQAGAWQEYDPERLRPRAPAFYLVDGQLRSLDGGLANSPATDGQLALTDAAVSPDGALALLSPGPGGQELRIGPQAGPFTVRLRGRLSSPSWGSAEQGLWLLRHGDDGSELLLLPPIGPQRRVELEELPDGAAVQTVRMARDGVRVALVVGAGRDARLLVGRLAARVDEPPAVVGLTRIAPSLTGVTDVAWESGTSLVLIARFTLGQLPARIAVDGSGLTLLASRLPQDVDPLEVTTAAGRPVVLAGRVPGQGGGPPTALVHRDDGRAFVREAEGHAPFYPG